MNNRILPRIYEDPFGNYPQHKNKYKLSYSQYNSWISPLYREDYIRSYFMGKRDDSGVFAKFGSACGEYLEKKTIDRKWLTDSDIKVLDAVPRYENSRYEVEIVIDRGWYVIQGFIDQETAITDSSICIIDFKTGNITTKKDYYGSKEYQQTTIYSHQRHLEGQSIHYSGVTLLGRKGMGTLGSRLYLNGPILNIETPYSVERAEEFLLEMDAVAEDISEAFALYKSVLKL